MVFFVFDCIGMKYGICLLSIAPCRIEANDRSEMVTQLLFGDLVKITSRKEKWLKIKIDTDGYEAWVDHQQIQELTEKEFTSIKSATTYLTEDILSPVINMTDNQMIPILLGSSVYGLNKEKTQSAIKAFQFKIEGHVRSIPKKLNRQKLIEDAFLYLNAPYLWGGKTPLGIDCSGFVQMVYRLNGVELPRDAHQQAEIGQALSFIEEAAEGDLAFFDNSEGKIIHVGIILKGNRIIHASGKVRVDRLDHQGIFRNESNAYSHSLRIIKKVF